MFSTGWDNSQNCPNRSSFKGASDLGGKLRITDRNFVRQRIRQSGFMLAESLVATLIVGTGIMAAVASLSTSTKATTLATEGATAAWLMTSQVELIKSEPYVLAPGAYPTVTPPPGFTVQNSTTAFPGGGGYIQDVKVEIFKSGHLVSSVDMLKIDN